MKKVLQGLGVSKGKVKGTVKIIKNFDEHPEFNEGDILVTRITDPTMVPMMNKAAGIICEIGGLTSHPSVLSRELGIPCIVSVKDVMKILKDGDIIHMCGESGIIEHISSKLKESWRLRW